MKIKHLFLVLAMLMMGLIAVSCVTTGGDDGDGGDVTNPPNFVSDACGGCPADQMIGTTGITFFSYVRNNGGDGDVSMTIDAGNGSTTQKFTVKAGTSYTFQASVPVSVSSSTSFTYYAQFPGTPGYTDSHAKSGYHVTGAPYGMQFTAR
jgi:hypothetical protein